jgi:hypothetical protein
VRVPHLSPTTLTTDEQRLIPRATQANVRDSTIAAISTASTRRA